MWRWDQDGYRRMTPEDTAAAEQEKERKQEQKLERELEAVLQCFGTDWCSAEDAKKRRPAIVPSTRFGDHVKALLEAGRLEDNGERPRSPQRKLRIPGGIVPLT